MDSSQEAYLKSIELLKQLTTEKGFIASVKEVANYKRVWSRDGIIAGLAGMLTGDTELKQTFRTTLQTLALHQDHTGRIPSNVSLDEKTISYGTTVGRVDATTWFIIGVCQYAIQTGDGDFFTEFQERIEKALFYLECLELNGRGLLYVPQGGNWADEYITHAYVLYDQVLYYTALKSYHSLTKNEVTQAKLETLRDVILINYFPTTEHLDHPSVYSKALFEMSCKSYKPPLPLCYFSPHTAHNHRIANFDNALLLLTDIVDTETKQAITSSVFAKCAPDNFPILPAFAPVIDDTDPAWDQLTSNYRYNFKNEPYKFHNGGLWPLVHGFFLAGASSYDNEIMKKLDSFAVVLQEGAYTFPEFYHGKTFEPLGTKYLGFSAAGYIIAYSLIKNDIHIFRF
jgi:hypothetical protein